MFFNTSSFFVIRYCKGLLSRKIITLINDFYGSPDQNGELLKFTMSITLSGYLPFRIGSMYTLVACYIAFLWPSHLTKLSFGLQYFMLSKMGSSSFLSFESRLEGDVIWNVKEKEKQWCSLNVHPSTLSETAL